MIRRRAPLALALLCATLTSLAGAAPASAAPERTLLSEVGISGSKELRSISIDPSEHIWLSDFSGFGPGEAPILELAPYPSTAQIGEQTGEGKFSSPNRIAFSASTGDLYVPQAGEPSEVSVFEGGTGPFLRKIFPAAQDVRIAVDNSGLSSAGRLYAAGFEVEFGEPEYVVQALEPDDSPHAFSASAPYISGDRITGTPDGPFGRLPSIAVDPQGDIYVLEQRSPSPPEQFLYEYSPAGVLLLSIDLGAETEQPLQVAVDPHTNAILVLFAGGGKHQRIAEFDPSGQPIDKIPIPLEPPLVEQGFKLTHDLAVNNQGYLYVVGDTHGEPEEGAVAIYSPLALPRVLFKDVEVQDPNSAMFSAEVDPNSAGGVDSCTLEYGRTGRGFFAYDHTAPCSPTPPPSYSSPTDVTVHLGTLAPEATYRARVTVTNEAGDRTYSPPVSLETPVSVHGVETGAATEITNASASVQGSFTGDGSDIHYYFAYGTSTNYGHASPVPSTDQGTATGTQNATATLEGLVPNTTYHYALVAENHFGPAFGPDRTFTTFQGPTIEALSSFHVTATSAFLEAQINPHGLPAGTEADCHFEYGPTPEYGGTAPCPAALTGTSGVNVSVPIEGLNSGIVYHFRVIAHNRWGTVTSEDQTFEFFPPSCPNSAVRQQLGSAYLPDCRAYELVSPGDANGTLLYPGGPNTGLASSPSRFSFTGNYSALPGSNTINTAGDLYVATRGSAGWTSRYIGLPGDQAGCMGGPPTAETSRVVGVNPPFLTNSVFSDPSMSHFINFVDGAPIDCLSGTNGISDAINAPFAPPSNAPYLWNADGVLERRLPGSIDTPGALDALNCPYEEGSSTVGLCTGETTASPDLGHLIFSSNLHSFSGPEQAAGLTAPPGSAYDENLSTGEVTLISLLPNGENIPQDPTYANTPLVRNVLGLIDAFGGPQEFIRFPAVSTDGSHILMSTSTARTPFCPRDSGEIEVCPTYKEKPLHLYMRINDAVTYEIAEGKAVNYVAMTPDGSKLYFSSPARLTGEDHDDSADLYIWSAEKAEHDEEPLTLVSKGDNAGVAGEPGNTDECSPAVTRKLSSRGGEIEEEEPWTTACGVLPYSGNGWSWMAGGVGGNGFSDTALATANGDIYFYSPEQLDGDRGLLGQQNLYLYRAGRLQFVATLKVEHHCAKTGHGRETVCSDGPVTRIDVTPNDSRMAFVTASRLTSYDNAGRLEMYSYTPSTEALVCDSCRPDGRPATGDVVASQDGRFITDDGRVFFSTPEALVSQDTNEGPDVYEFVDGRPQLITPGTGVASFAKNIYGNESHPAEQPGLVGVSADGTDVYFSTLDNLTGEDHNGNFLKFYDARTNGGFPQPPPIQPCAAAEECHGPGTEAPLLPAQGTAANLSGGNLTSHRHHGKKHHKKATHKRHRRRTSANYGAGR